MQQLEFHLLSNIRFVQEEPGPFLLWSSRLPALFIKQINWNWSHRHGCSIYTSRRGACGQRKTSVSRILSSITLLYAACFGVITIQESPGSCYWNKCNNLSPLSKFSIEICREWFFRRYKKFPLKKVDVFVSRQISKGGHREFNVVATKHLIHDWLQNRSLECTFLVRVSPQARSAYKTSTLPAQIENQSHENKRHVYKGINL